MTPDALVELVVDLCASSVADGRRLRVAVDGHPTGGTGPLADAVAAALRARGTTALLRVSTRWFLRPASLRFEFGKQDIQSYAESWLDVSALRREVLDPLGPGGSGRWLPTRWDPDADRATRAPYETAPALAVLLVDGPLLLSRGLPFDLTVHLHLSAGARSARTPDEEKWTLPAYEDYDRTVRPTDTADVVVRTDDPRHPAVVLRH
ncbi:nucleoside/nucleotide kinase family protein [Fodinicola feengrottensis]|uniref:hypothetical protein n=1 Tax=Fodinicola feengrottensis TaxID=435914 RepID=UPI002441B116|nr:hypothetical protein [Fodinicola feengrottensis]